VKQNAQHPSLRKFSVEFSGEGTTNRDIQLSPHGLDEYYNLDLGKQICEEKITVI